MTTTLTDLSLDDLDVVIMKNHSSPDGVVFRNAWIVRSTDFGQLQTAMATVAADDGYSVVEERLRALGLEARRKLNGIAGMGSLPGNDEALLQIGQARDWAKSHGRLILCEGTL
ncbi:MAG: hypothetical protein KDD69_10330 [Bdellovibrionales bacterium]|nr:hypothetical protein [Bdellovibrionales bacterium]